MTPHDPGSLPDRRVLRAAIWLPGLAVALGAAIATAHGLYEVAVAAQVPVGIAWLYPLITDGLALVAYAATVRLTGRARRYAWVVVILAAGLSGLAQASYLAATPADGAAGFTAPGVLRFGVGAWPAVAAAIVAHLLYLLATDPERDSAQAQREPGPDCPAVQSPVQPALFSGAPVPLDAARHTAGVQPAADSARPTPPATAEQPAQSPARARARTVAARHADRHGALPTVTRLAELAGVSRGTAAAVLKTLREQPVPLHLVTENPEPRTRP